MREGQLEPLTPGLVATLERGANELTDNRHEHACDRAAGTGDGGRRVPEGTLLM